MSEKFHNKMSRLRNETFSNLNKYGLQSASQLEKLWLKIYGDNEEVFVERYQTIEKHIKDLYDEMIKEETENYDIRKVALDESIKRSKQLSEELSVEIKLPHVNINGDNIRKQLKDVQNALEEFQNIKEERLRILDNYKGEEEEVCGKLGEIPEYSMFSGVPSEAKLKEIKSRIISLNSEKVKRSKIFKSMISEIDELVRDLEIENDLKYSQRALLDDYSDVVLSHAKLQEVSDWKQELINLKDEQEKQIESLKEKTVILWNRIDICGEERENIILKTFKTCGKSVLKTWSDELDRCEHLKLANIKEVILRLREVIAYLWDECHLDEDERSGFLDFLSDDFNEELLEAHEKEEERLRKYYDETKDLYKTAEKWFELWNKMISLESRSGNSQRLNNRGGQLLKEEKERKAVHKELPKVESKLEKMISKFEETHRKAFLYEGIPLMSLITQYYENRKAEKENEKEFRKVQNMTRVTPMKSQSRIAPSPLNSRPRARTPTTQEATSMKRTAVKRQLKMPERSAKKEALSKRRSRSQDPAGHYEKARILRSNSANSSVSSYSGYQVCLEKSKTTLSGISLNSLSPTTPSYGIPVKSTSSLFKTPTSAVKSSTKKTRLNTYSASRIARPRY